MRFIQSFLAFSFICLMTACATSQKEVPTFEAVAEECNFPGTDDEDAPLWVCTGAVDGLITGLGYYPEANLAFNLARQIAQQRARADLSRKLKVFVLGELDDRSVATGVSGNTTVDEYQSDITTSVTNATLRGTRIYSSVMDENGGLYILVAIDEKLAKSNLTRRVQSSYNNDEAAFLKEESKAALSELRSRNGL